MADSRTIGGLAREAGVPVSTVRYYERRGLLSPNERSHSRYRLYHQSALVRLRFIRAAQASGFSLEDVEALLNLREGGRQPRAAVRAMIESRLAELRERVTNLEAIRAVLERALSVCRAGGPPEKCPVIEGLCACGEKHLTLHPGSTPIIGGSQVAGERPRHGTKHSARSVRR